MRRLRGFTLIEMAVVVAIVGVLASVVLPLAQVAVKRSQEQELRRGLREIRLAIDAYKAAVDAGRIPRKVGTSGYPPRLEDLERGVEDVQTPMHNKIYFLRRLPRDPFAEAHLPAADTWGKRSYVSPPDMPAEGDDVFDVYSRSEANGLNGVPYRKW